LVFLALSRHSPQAASALETLLGCEQREPEKLSEMLTHLLSLPGTLVFDLSGCGESGRLGTSLIISARFPRPEANAKKEDCGA
ncbi:hypothetical protein, partial [uncultured Rikenella sp.]|uniref:hypothetical protein n=1 Tax=uncultured Rikenella sp. TaxID=368003 RepID=UPI002605B924